MDYIRIRITRKNEETEYLTLVECTMLSAVLVLTGIFKDKTTSSHRNKTTIQVREALGGINGKCTSICLSDITTEKVKERIINHFTNN